MRQWLLLAAALSAQLAGWAQAVAKKLDADVIVIGLGPVGNFMCHLFSGYQVGRVLAFEKHSNAYFAPRAVSWDDYTIRSAEIVGGDVADWMHGHAYLWTKKFNQEGCMAGLRSGPAADRWKVACDTPNSNKMWNKRLMLKSRPPITPFHQPTWERFLRKKLLELPGVEVTYGMEVVDVQIAGDACWVKVQELSKDGLAGEPKVYSARYCLAADGAQSPVRQKLGLSYEGSTFPDEPWVVVDTEITDKDYLRNSWIFREGSGFIMNWKCPFVYVATPAYYEEWWAEAEAAAAHASSYEEKREIRRAYIRKRSEPFVQNGTEQQWPVGTAFRFEFLLEANTTEKEATSDAFVKNILRECAEIDVDRVSVKRKVVYEFSARRAEKWRVGPVLLAGDAAHCMPPFQGQGMNSGLRDVINIAWKLSLVLRGVVPDSLLDTFETERRSNLEQVTKESIQLGEMVMQRKEMRAWLRDLFVSNMNKLRERSESAEAVLSGMVFSEPPNIISEDSILGDGPESTVAGKLMPCPSVRLPKPGDATPAALDDFLMQRGFTFIYLHPGRSVSHQGPGRLSADDLAFLRLINATAVTVVGSSGRKSWLLFSGMPAGWSWSAVEQGKIPVIEDLPSVRAPIVVDTDGHFTRWVLKHSLGGQVLVVRPDKYIFGNFLDLGVAVRQLRSGLLSPRKPRAAAKTEL